MHGTQYTPFELGQIAFKQGHKITSNPFYKLEAPFNYNSEAVEWDNGFLTEKARALEATKNRPSLVD